MGDCVREHEHLHQCALIRWTHVMGYPYDLLFAIPNGGKRDIITAKKLKKEGVTAGIPDLMLPVARSERHGLFIELKAGRNKATPQQKAKMKQLTSEGYKCCVCNGWDAAKLTIEEYLNED